MVWAAFGARNDVVRSEAVRPATTHAGAVASRDLTGDSPPLRRAKTPQQDEWSAPLGDRRAGAGPREGARRACYLQLPGLKPGSGLPCWPGWQGGLGGSASAAVDAPKPSRTPRDSPSAMRFLMLNLFQSETESNARRRRNDRTRAAD